MTRDELIVQALAGMGVAVTAEQLKKARAIVDRERLRGRLGRPAFFDAPMPAWVRWRRRQERQSGFSDPLLVRMGFSALPDAPPKPPKPTKPLQQPTKPLQSPETGSGAWAASLSWASSD